MTPQERKVFELALEALKANHLLIHGSETKGGLSFCMDGYYSGCFDIDSNDKQTNEAITAIDEVLAQPEYQSTADKSKLEKVPAKGTLLAQPEHEFVRGECVKCGASIERQEPVAWMDDYNACKCPDNEARCFSDKVFRMMQKHTDSLVKRQEPVAKVCHDLDGHIGWNPNLKQLPNEGTPLYTTPPQPEQEPCDMGKMCIGCSPRNADGSCPDAQRKPLTDEQISEYMPPDKPIYEYRYSDATPQQPPQNESGFLPRG